MLAIVKSPFLWPDGIKSHSGEGASGSVLVPTATALVSIYHPRFSV